MRGEGVDVAVAEDGEELLVIGGEDEVFAEEGVGGISGLAGGVGESRGGGSAD